jgi:hypothetical protein
VVGIPSEESATSATWKLAAGQNRPSVTPLIFTHIFGWTPGVEFEVQLWPRFPGALYKLCLGLCIRARDDPRSLPHNPPPDLSDRGLAARSG